MRRAALRAQGMLAGAPPNVLSAAGRALQAVEEAWRVLADPAARESYDENMGAGGGGGPGIAIARAVRA